MCHVCMHACYIIFQNGDTALIVSARNEDTDLVGVLLDSGADPDAQGQVRISLHCCKSMVVTVTDTYGCMSILSIAGTE